MEHNWERLEMQQQHQSKQEEKKHKTASAREKFAFPASDFFFLCCAISRLWCLLLLPISVHGDIN